MLQRSTGAICRAALLALIGMAAAHAHHPMGYSTPASALEGLLSGLGHPILEVDHLLFIIAAGVLAARVRGGFLLPLAFVVASNVAVALRAGGAGWEPGELWVAASLVALGLVMMARREPGRPLVVVLFLASGAVHGYALAETIVGAEPTPLYAYCAGLTIVQCAIAWAAAWAMTGFARRNPRLDLQRFAGTTAGVAGLVFAGLALLG